MQDLNELLTLSQQALWLTVALSLPIVGVAALVSMVMAIFQAATQVQDMTIAHLPRFIAVVLSLAVAGPWIGTQLTAFAQNVFALAL